MPNEIYHRSEWGNPNPEGWGDIYFDPAATNKLYNHSDYYENSDGTDKILRDIPNKASIVLTPTAYSDGSINTVIPPYQVLPTELVTNGTFDTDSDWTKGTGWSISNGKASRTSQSGSTACDQSISLIAGRKYKIIYTLTINAGSFNVRFSGTTNVNGLTRTTSGTYTDFLVAATGNNTFRLVGADGSFVGSIDNVSVKEVQEADFDFSRGSSATRVNEKGLIEDVASGIPRIDYTTGFGSWLLEPQRTNSLLQSNQFDTTWTLSAGTDLTSGQTGVGGSDNAWLLKKNTTGSRYIQQSLSLSSAQYSYSVYLKAESTNWAYIWSYDGAASVNAYFDLENGVVGQTGGVAFDGTKIESVGNGWYRCTLIYTHAPDLVRIYPADADGSVSTGTDNGIFIQYAQLEAGSYQTSIIKTEGSTVTRAAETANNSGNADLFNDSEGVLYAGVSTLVSGSETRVISLSGGSQSVNNIYLNFNSSGTLSSQVLTSGGNVNLSAPNIKQTLQNKLAVKYKANDCALWINGFEIDTDTSMSSTPTGLDRLNFDFGAGSLDFYGKTKELAVFKEALTDAELESLTSWVSFTEMANDLEYTLE